MKLEIHFDFTQSCYLVVLVLFAWKKNWQSLQKTLSNISILVLTVTLLKTLNLEHILFEHEPKARSDLTMRQTYFQIMHFTCTANGVIILGVWCYLLNYIVTMYRWYISIHDIFSWKFLPGHKLNVIAIWILSKSSSIQ